MGKSYKCVGYKANEKSFTKGKIYEIDKNRRISNDEGFCYANKPFTLEHWLAQNYYDFVEVKGEEKKTDFNPTFSQIHIKSDGYRTIAKMKNKSEEVKCHPDDTFEYAEGCVRVIERLFGFEGRWTGKDDKACEKVNNKPNQPIEGEYVQNRRVKIVDIPPHKAYKGYVCQIGRASGSGRV